jgi:hypothetical protein
MRKKVHISWYYIEKGMVDIELSLTNINIKIVMVRHFLLLMSLQLSLIIVYLLLICPFDYIIQLLNAYTVTVK